MHLHQFTQNIKQIDMKKTVLTITASLLMFSCSKEPLKDCNCGLITSDNVQNYTISVKNDCNDRIEVVILTQGEWMNAHPGDQYCK